ncbi:cadherin-like domain-containing protein, partial [Vulcanococcus sp.]|uniref:cadherin-like domain-containing protein n=1 Tax=Vulcanococcus sp. TaxID=2856995 RepID=UPI003C00E1B4
MATTSVTTAGLNLLSGGGFELNWVIRGTEWSNGSIPSGWQAISTHVASGSGSSGSAASDLVAIQRQVNSQADQAYALRMQFPGALPKGAELRVEWAGEEVARFDSASIGSYQSHTLMLPGIDGGALLKLITNRGVAFGSINGLGLWAQPEGARPLSLPASAKVGQSLVANTDSIADVDGLGDFNYQWQRKDDATQKWVNVDGGTQKTLKLNQDLVGSQLRVEVGYVDEDGFQEVLVSQATEDIQHANRAPSAGGIKQLASGQEDQSVLITAADLLAGSSDLDGDNLSLRRVRLTSGQGSLSRVDASTWRYTPRENWFGEVNLSYQISDGKAIAKASASLLIEPVNDAPTASTVTLSAIEEDSVALISEADLLATANDIDGDVLSVDGLEVLEGDGSLSQNADGSWSFTPNGNWNGAVRLGYSVSDGNGGSVQVAAKLTVDPVNDAPELTGEMAVLADGREDRAMTIQAADLLQGFTDPDGDPLQVINLRVSEGEGSLQAGESGSWVFTPGKDWSGTVTLDYQVSDGELIWRNAAVGGSPEQFDGTDFESAPWNFTGQGGVYLEEVDGWTPPEGELIEVKNNGDGSGQAANGEQFIELNQDPLGFFPNASGVFKDITTNAGQEYELSLQYAGRAGYDEDVNRFEVLIDGVSQGTWSQSNTTATPGDSSLGGEHNWETINLKFTASGPATRVELKEAGSDLPFGRGMRIDDIRIASIGIKVPADTAQQSFVVIPG